MAESKLTDPTTTPRATCVHCGERIRKIVDNDTYDPVMAPWSHIWWSSDGRLMTGSPICDLTYQAEPEP